MGKENLTEGTMKDILETLSKVIGCYEGEGINHEGQPFIGRLALQPVLDGRGFTIKFSATGKEGTVYHQEESTIAPSINEKLVLWNFNTNTPGMVAHELRDSQAKTGVAKSLVFGFNQPMDTSTFREEIALDILSDSGISYTYSWGLPGGEFQERSGVRMAKIELANSPQALLEKYKVEINKHHFDTLEPLISQDCKFWFSSGTFVGLKQTRNAFEKTWSLIKEEVYSLTDIEWIAESDLAAVCTYTFHWKGLIDGKPGEGKGRGTSCLRQETDGWKITHEHLSNFPK
jgi:ketosteroid isomerase-like protein